MSLIVIFIAVIFLHSLFSARLERTVLTAPIVFTTAGITALLLMPELRDRQVDQELFLSVAEIGLVLLLFSDAFRTDLAALKDFRRLPVRLLSIGMLSTILLGIAAALVVFTNLSFWEAGILAAILAPTDAGLGQVIVNSPRVPLKIRQSLNVEAGLNDGLSVPFMLFFIALVSGTDAAGEHATLKRLIVEQLGYGAIIGIGIGLAGGFLLRTANRRHWSSPAWNQLGVAALPLLCMLASEPAGASMFIAAFVGGMAAQFGFKSNDHNALEFAESWGQVFNLATFFLFGLLVARDWKQFDARHLLYAVLSLTIVRMLPVAVALGGTRLSLATVTFMGWFGPRGLASIVLGLVYLEHAARQPGTATIQLAVMATVLLSVFAHGLSALPGIKSYEQRLRTLPPDAPEFVAAGAEPVEPIHRTKDYL